MGVGEIILGECKITAILNVFFCLFFLSYVFWLVCLFHLTMYITPKILHLVLGALGHPSL